jgi:hypothetical protein
MRKNEMAKAGLNELIVDYVRSYGLYLRNMNLGLGEKRLGKHCEDLENELLRRGILSETDIAALRK